MGNLQTFDARLEEDPYRDDNTLIAQRIDLTTSAAKSDHDLKRELGNCRTLLEMMHKALAYWTPERVEREALKRAQDAASPSVIAQEVAHFTVYCNVLAMNITEFVVSLLPRHVLHLAAQADWLTTRLRDSLLALERRAAAAEQRAMDHRLRYDAERLRAIVARQELTSATMHAIQEALRDRENQDHLAEVAERLEQVTQTIAPTLEAVQAEVIFIADSVTKSIAAESLPAAQKAAEELLKLAKREPLKLVLRMIASAVASAV